MLPLFFVMRILITGGTGLVGLSLSSFLAFRKHEVFVLSRDIIKARNTLPSAINVLSYKDKLPLVDVIVNLAGESISKKFLTADRLKKIEQSRLDLINYLYIAYKNAMPSLFIQASAITQENTAFNKICNNVENRCKIKFAKTNVAIARFGIVLSAKGGILKTLSYLPKLNFINGHNYVPYITLTDTINAINTIIKHNITGVVDICSDYPMNLQNIILRYQHSLIVNSITLPLVKEVLLSDKRGSLLLIDKKVQPTKLLEHSMRFDNFL